MYQLVLFGRDYSFYLYIYIFWRVWRFWRYLSNSMNSQCSLVVCSDYKELFFWKCIVLRIKSHVLESPSVVISDVASNIHICFSSFAFLAGLVNRTLVTSHNFIHWKYIYTNLKLFRSGHLRVFRLFINSLF